MSYIDRNRRKAQKLRARAALLDQKLIDQHRDDDLESVVQNVVGRATNPQTPDGVNFIEYDHYRDAYVVPRFEVERLSRELRIQADQAIVNGERYAAIQLDYERVALAVESLAKENERLEERNLGAAAFRGSGLHDKIAPETPPSALRFPENGGS